MKKISNLILGICIGGCVEKIVQHKDIVVNGMTIVLAVLFFVILNYFRN